MYNLQFPSVITQIQQVDMFPMKMSFAQLQIRKYAELKYGKKSGPVYALPLFFVYCQ